jgi:predicted O-methyltransferase YrrM
MTFAEAVDVYDILSIAGFMHPHELEWLFETAAGMSDGATIVELGTFGGRSACAILAGLASAGVTANFTSIDRRPMRLAAKNILERGLPVPDLVHGECRDDSVCGMFADGSVDWIFVDADHGNTAEQLEVWAPKLKAGGLMSGHDITWPDVRAAVEDKYGKWLAAPGSLWTIEPAGGE